MALKFSILQSASSGSQVCGPTERGNLPFLVAYWSNFLPFSDIPLNEEIVSEMGTKDCQERCYRQV